MVFGTGQIGSRPGRLPARSSELRAGLNLVSYVAFQGLVPMPHHTTIRSLKSKRKKFTIRRLIFERLLFVAFANFSRRLVRLQGVYCANKT